MRENTRNIFITGATGFLASNFLQTLLAEEKNRLYTLIRAKDNSSLLRRKDALIKELFAKDARNRAASRMHVFRGDISKKGLGLGKKELDGLRDTIDVVYHSAAICDFSCELDLIRKANVTGTENVLELALDWQKNGHLENVNHISTAYIAGDYSGTFYEKDTDVSQNFNNTYEQSKFEAELVVSEYRKKSLRVDIYRPAIITDTFPPSTGASFGIIKLLRLISQGTFRNIPADGEARINLAPVDLVSRAIHLISTAKDRPANRNYHIVNPMPAKFDALLDTISGFFGTKKPVCIPAKRFPADGLSDIQKRILKHFIPYMNQRLSFDAQNAVSVLKKYGFTIPALSKSDLVKTFEHYQSSGFTTKKNRFS